MVLGFALLLAAYALINSGWTGRGIGAVLQGMPGGRGFTLSDINVPDVAFQTAPAHASDDGAGGTQSASYGDGGASTAGGARGMADLAQRIAARHGVVEISRLRPGASTTSGNLSDHSENSPNKAATDLSNTGNKGPSSEQDAAVEEIAAAFGKRVNGKTAFVKSWNYEGFRIQLIHRTPAYGDHRGHIHAGFKRI